jgi:hypothetical protein
MAIRHIKLRLRIFLVNVLPALAKMVYVTAVLMPAKIAEPIPAVNVLTVAALLVTVEMRTVVVPAVNVITQDAGMEGVMVAGLAVAQAPVIKIATVVVNKS